MKISIQNYAEPGTVVLDAPLIDQLTRGNIIDAPITLLREDPPIWLLPTAMQQNGDIYLSHTLLKGYLGDLSDAEYCIINEHDLFLIPEHLQKQNNGRHWITNLLHTESGVLAFLHSEYTADGDYFGMPSIRVDGGLIRAPGRSAISLAWLPKDRLDTDIFQFNYLGHIATYCADTPHFNVSGTPVFVNTDNGTEYINILFSDMLASQGTFKPNAKSTPDPEGWEKIKSFVSQARAPLKEVIASAKKGKLTGWLKRNCDEWSDAKGKLATGVIPKVDGHSDRRIADGEVIVHSDIARIDPSGMYILVAYVLTRKDRTTYSVLNPTCLVVYSSEDGLNWKFETTSNERTDCDTGWSYVKLLCKGRRANDQSLYALIGWEYGKDARSVHRLEIGISDSEQDKSSSPRTGGSK